MTKTTRSRCWCAPCCCDLLKIHYLCGDKDNVSLKWEDRTVVVICSKFITFAVTKTTEVMKLLASGMLWFAQNSLPLRWQRQPKSLRESVELCCDLLKIHYLCGDKDNYEIAKLTKGHVVICSKFITFAVTKTTHGVNEAISIWLWFAQNSLPLRWQRQLRILRVTAKTRCDLLKIHYLCGDKDNFSFTSSVLIIVVICSKFITFAVTKTTSTP